MFQLGRHTAGWQDAAVTVEAQGAQGLTRSKPPRLVRIVLLAHTQSCARAACHTSMKLRLL